MAQLLCKVIIYVSAGALMSALLDITPWQMLGVILIYTAAEIIEEVINRGCST